MRRKPAMRVALIMLLASTAPAVRADECTTSTLTVRTDQAGPVISRDIFGQFAEHLGEGIYGGVWVGPDSPIPNVRESSLADRSANGHPRQQDMVVRNRRLDERWCRHRIMPIARKFPGHKCAPRS